MRHYELLVVIKPTLTEEETSAKVESIKGILETNGSEVVKTDLLGIKTLGFEIEKHKRGYYAVYYFKGEPSSLKEVERLNRIDESLLRFVTIKYESKQEIKCWDNLVLGKKDEFKPRKRYTPNKSYDNKKPYDKKPYEKKTSESKEEKK